MKVPKDISLEEINKFFGPIVNKNGYNYEFTKDPFVYWRDRNIVDGGTPKAVYASIMLDIIMNG